MIKNIEDLKKVQIVCRNQEQVKNCLSYLKQLGFDVDCYDSENYLIVLYDTSFDGFITSYELEKKYIEFYNKELVKTLQKFIKEKEEQEKEKKEEKLKDFEVAEDGRITKINDYTSEQIIYVACDYTHNKEGFKIYKFKTSFLDFALKYGLAYAIPEARDRAMFKLEIETKLKNIAERLNNGRKIDWEDRNQVRYSLFYDYEDKKLKYCFGFDFKYQEVIYCLDINFLDIAKKEIGEQDLIKYFKED